MEYLRFDETLLTAEEEVELAKRVEAGIIARAALDDETPTEASGEELCELARLGEDAYHRMITSNLRLVALVVTSARCAYVGSDELFQEGVLGLMEAVRRFDHRRGFRFATFALPWIRMRVAEVVATQAGRIGLPPGRAKSWRQAHARRMDLAAELGRNPTIEELAGSWGRPVAWVEQLLSWRFPAPLPESLAEEPAADPEDGRIDELDAGRLLRPIRGELRRVIKLRFGLGEGEAMSVSQVATELGMSESTVRRRERAAMAILRAELDLDTIAA